MKENQKGYSNVEEKNCIYSKRQTRNNIYPIIVVTFTHILYIKYNKYFEIEVKI